MMKRAVLIWGLALSAGVTAASDGTIDVNVNPATTFVISAPGSYRVVNDVTMNAGVSAIQINAADVQLDLGGHALTGSGGASSGGIVKGAAADAGARVTLSNGKIRGFSGEGILLGDKVTVHDVIVVDNGSWGANLGDSSVVKNSQFLGNASAATSGGVRLGSRSVIKDCMVGDMSLGADVWGIYLGPDSSAISNSVTNIAVTAGTATGIYLDHRATITGNTITGLSGPAVYGIDTGDSASVRGNDIKNLAASTGVTYGIELADGGHVEGNNCSDNTAGNACYGIYANSGCTIRGNTCYRNRSTNNGDAIGISTNTNCTIEGNTCIGQEEAPNLASVAYGIRTSSSQVVNNNCSQNVRVGVGGSGVGISAGSRSLVKGNRCEGNTGGVGAGILASVDNLVIGNFTASNSGAGISLTGSGNRCEMNRATEGTGVATGGGDSIGAGDLANISF